MSHIWKDSMDLSLLRVNPLRESTSGKRHNFHHFLGFLSFFFFLLFWLPQGTWSSRARDYICTPAATHATAAATPDPLTHCASQGSSTHPGDSEMPLMPLHYSGNSLALFLSYVLILPVSPSSPPPLPPVVLVTTFSSSSSVLSTWSSSPASSSLSASSSSLFSPSSPVVLRYSHWGNLC